MMEVKGTARAAVGRRGRRRMATNFLVRPLPLVAVAATMTTGKGGRYGQGTRAGATTTAGKDADGQRTSAGGDNNVRRGRTLMGKGHELARQ